MRVLAVAVAMVVGLVLACGSGGPSPTPLPDPTPVPGQPSPAEPQPEMTEAPVVTADDALLLAMQRESGAFAHESLVETTVEFTQLRYAAIIAAEQELPNAGVLAQSDYECDAEDRFCQPYEWRPEAWGWLVIRRGPPGWWIGDDPPREVTLWQWITPTGYILPQPVAIATVEIDSFPPEKPGD